LINELNMNDVTKGVSILAVTALGIGWMLAGSHDFNIAFLDDRQAAEQEAANIQQRILTGDDPTVFQSPTAAGQSQLEQPRTEFNGAVNETLSSQALVPDADCFHGQITSPALSEPNATQNAFELENQPYVGVVHNDQVYLRLIGQPVYLRWPKGQPNMASQEAMIPAEPASALADLDAPSSQCEPTPITLGPVVTF
jgi:hypothetical protein